MDDYMWCFQLFDFNRMCSYGILTWYWYPRLGHTPFLTWYRYFKLGYIPFLTWYWYPRLGHTAFVTWYWYPRLRHTLFLFAGAYPLLSSWFRCLIFLIIRVIYWNFLDAILGHTPSSFELFAPQVHRWLSSIVSESPIFSTALRHRVWISFIFDGSPTSCLDPLSFRRLSSIVPGSLFLFYSSPTSCLDPLSFRRLSGIVFGSHFFS